MIEIRWHGRGGQGAKTAAVLLADVASRVGWHAQAFPEYGPERMGAPVVAYNRLSKEAIRIHTPITNPDYVVVLDPSFIGSQSLVRGLGGGEKVLVNTTRSPADLAGALGVPPDVEVIAVDASGIAARHLGRDIPNTPMMAALIGVMEIMELGKLKETLRGRLESKFGDRPELVEGNLKAVEEAFSAIARGGGRPVASTEAAVKSPSRHPAAGWRELPLSGILRGGATSSRWQTGDWRNYRPKHIPENCIHCLLCWVFCPDIAVVVRDGRMVGFDYDHCKGCGICAEECPTKDKAIRMVPEIEEGTGR